MRDMHRGGAAYRFRQSFGVNEKIYLNVKFIG